MNLNFNSSFEKLLPYIFTILFAYVIASVLFLFLPKSGVEFQESNKNELNIKKYDGFYSKFSQQNNQNIEKKVDKNIIETLSKYQLKAVYSTISNGGWIIVEEKTKKETIIIAQDENLDGYILKKLYKNFVLFEKNSKEFKLELPKDEDVNYEVETVKSPSNEKIVVKDNSVTVNRNYLNSYVNDLDKVWKDIAISDVRKNGAIEGFKVEKIAKNSVFEKLGLKQNDIIKSVNGNKIESYADAFKIYNEINKLDFLNLEVLRSNELVELNYEID